MSDDHDRVYHRVGGTWHKPWDDLTHLMAFYVLTNELRRTEGIYKLPVGYIVDDRGWTRQRVRKALAVLEAEDFIRYDDESSVCVITKALLWQPLANPNQVTAAVRRIATLPASRLDSDFHELAERFCQRLANGLAERLPERFAKPLSLALPPTLSSAAAACPATASAA